MATITGRIASPSLIPMSGATVNIRRVDNSITGELLNDGAATVPLSILAEFSIQLVRGRFLLTVYDTSDVIDITVPSETGTFSVSDILTTSSLLLLDQPIADMGEI
jgi:hypothetical protein